jgi:hypothetical protein
MTPTPAQRRVLQLLSDGRQIERLGNSYRVRQTWEPVPRVTLAACLARRWITDMPGLPLFDQECRLTSLEVEALGPDQHARDAGAAGLIIHQSHRVS